MQDTTPLYKQLLAVDHEIETSLVVGEGGVLIDEYGNQLQFGAASSTDPEKVEITVDRGGPDDGFRQDVIRELKTHKRMFKDEQPTFGGVIVGEIDLTMNYTPAQIPRRAQLVPYVRLSGLLENSETGELELETSEWLQKGVYYISTRNRTDDDDDVNTITFHGYDALALAQKPYPSDTGNSSSSDLEIARLIASDLGTRLSPETIELLEDPEHPRVGRYFYGLLLGYSEEEVLCFIAAPYCGNWITNDKGQLHLSSILNVPYETYLIADETGYTLVFGKDEQGEDVRIMVTG